MPNVLRLKKHVEGPAHAVTWVEYMARYPEECKIAEKLSTGEDDSPDDEDEWVKEQERKFVQDCGYRPGPILDSTIQLMQINAGLEKTYKKLDRLGKRDLDILKAVRDNSKQITSNIESMEAIKKTNTVSEISKLHQDTMDEAEKYVEEHIGEFAWACPDCSTIITSGGVPHWALVRDHDNNYVPWSSEIMALVNEGMIKLYHAAFILRTSIEGLMIVGQERGFKFTKSVNKIYEEKMLRGLMMKELNVKK